MTDQINSAPQKRKRPDYSDSKRMCLRTTPARTAHGLKRQRTTKRPNSFFDQLPFDVRHLVYGYLSLPPFADPIRPLYTAKDSRGLYLLCRRAKAEMDDEAPARLRTHLFVMQRKYCTGVAEFSSFTKSVELVLPKALEDGALALNTALDIRAVIHVFGQSQPICTAVVSRLGLGLLGVTV